VYGSICHIPSTFSRSALLSMGVFGRPFVKRFAQCYQTVVCRVLSCLCVCDVGVFWLNGWMDQDETWHAGRPRPWPHYVRWDSSSPSPKGAQSPIFSQYLLWPNGWMDQDATWYGGRPQPRPHSATWDPAPLPSQKGGTAPSIFRPMSVVAKLKRLDGLRYYLVRR